MVNRKLLFAKRHRGTFLFAFANFKTQESDIHEGKKPIIDKAGNLYMIYNLPDEELARKFWRTILRYNCNVEIEKDGDTVALINRVQCRRWISIFFIKKLWLLWRKKEMFNS
jgi:hypothetical protein